MNTQDTAIMTGTHNEQINTLNNSCIRGQHGITPVQALTHTNTLLTDRQIDR